MCYYIWVLELLPLLLSLFFLNQLPAVLLVILLGATTALLCYINLFGEIYKGKEEEPVLALLPDL